MGEFSLEHPCVRIFNSPGELYFVSVQVRLHVSVMNLHFLDKSMTILPFAKPILQLRKESIMKQATYEDAIQTARILKMDVDFVWRVIRGTAFRQYCDLRVAVLNSPISPSI